MRAGGVRQCSTTGVQCFAARIRLCLSVVGVGEEERNFVAEDGLLVSRLQYYSPHGVQSPAGAGRRFTRSHA